MVCLLLGGGHGGPTTSPAGIASVAAADSCMLALDYAQNKVRKFSIFVRDKKILNFLVVIYFNLRQLGLTYCILINLMLL